MTRRKPKLYEVKWVDSSWHQGWKTGLETVKVSSCSTIGYVLQDNKDSVVVAMSVSENGNFTEAMCIPKQSVTSKRRVRRV